MERRTATAAPGLRTSGTGGIPGPLREGRPSTSGGRTPAETVVRVTIGHPSASPTVVTLGRLSFCQPWVGSVSVHPRIFPPFTSLRFPHSGSRKTFVSTKTPLVLLTTTLTPPVN